jgi:hypothetical protein
MLNIEKLYVEAGVYFKTWRNPSPPQHDDTGTVYTNRFTEATKASPYWAAHTDQIVWPLFIIETIALIILVLVHEYR